MDKPKNQLAIDQRYRRAARLEVYYKNMLREDRLNFLKMRRTLLEQTTAQYSALQDANIDESLLLKGHAPVNSLPTNRIRII